MFVAFLDALMLYPLTHLEHLRGKIVSNPLHFSVKAEPCVSVDGGIKRLPVKRLLLARTQTG